MTALWLLVALALLAESAIAGEIFVPLVVSLFLAILLEPLVARAQVRGWRRNRASFAAVLVFMLAVFGVGWACSQPFSRIVGEFPQYRSKIRSVVVAVERKARPIRQGAAMVQSSKGPSDVRKASGGVEWTGILWRGVGSFVQAAGIAVFVPFLMAFGLSEKELLREAAERVGAGAWNMEFIEAETAQMVRTFFLGNLIAGLGAGLFHWIAFVGVGLTNAVGLGLLTGFFTIVPIIGLPAALLLPIAQGLLQFDSAMPFIVLAAALTAVHLFANNFVIPRLIGSRVKINATAATIGLLFWGWMWGIVGFLLAVPLTALIKIILEGNPRTAAIAGLFATRPRPAAPWFVWRRHAARRAEAPGPGAER